ncbi:alpha-amylase family glycosyl hydrolase [Rhodococcus sp. IEGM 1401]|uniref:Alpha-amylase family glycosyl hydrolase n=1 Tax=Rhodococcus cerastii TaxID=908616 RepID=A0ABU4D3G3_9NOCA|nr:MULTISPECIES: alpha-amylase family glycosyl hydrolase [Rhodococcus]MCZ4562417.1 alpha-amylase family glycosyl hydrolase [Rhodococcus sp. IEGM 1401]MDI9922459.1 alpha-amylase family glycosyl hydrolase [Rhodococcus sp. IEGM 1372]MDV6304269.1 alpha-amylase family glycosyl hydrolase [Rhodococcus cerastii]MDV8035009.1 alpha-amylase family glycosyl hydrolase [Rhodococcus sp. IEGM 1414]MDV8054627.1 alpha-amylase family glycosyl hydrolase [Rhodococcus sp. IEGM 1343]
MEWTKHAIWWHLYPLGFTGAPVHGWDGESQADLHRLNRIENWLDYALELGASGIALGPIFESEKHGYDTVDYFHIDGRLGTDEDIDSLIAAAHSRGLTIMFDGVFNHVAQSFPKFQEALTEGADSEAAGWFHLDWSGEKPTHRNFEGHDELVALDHESPDVQQYVVDVLSHWLERGVDAWRLDAAYAVSPRFWAAVLPKVREKHPDAYFLGEVIHGDYDRIVSASTLDSVTQYELWKAVWSGLSELNFFELSHALERHNGWLDAFVPATFVGNHDVNRIASVIEDERHLLHALVVLFTVGGMPMIYYGDEQAFRGIKEDRVGGDDEVRPEYPDTSENLAPYGWPVYRVHQELIALRRRNPWLYSARTETLELTNTALLYRAHADGESLTVALNLGDDAIDYPVQGDEVLAGEADLHDGRVSVPPHGWAVIG